MNATDKRIKVKKGTGYWNLTRYPWGGDFNRAQKDCIVPVLSITERRVVALLDGVRAGFEINPPCVELQ